MFSYGNNEPNGRLHFSTPEYLDKSQRHVLLNIQITSKLSENVFLCNKKENVVRDTVLIKKNSANSSFIFQFESKNTEYSRFIHECFQASFIYK